MTADEGLSVIAKGRKERLFIIALLQRRELTRQAMNDFFQASFENEVTDVEMSRKYREVTI